MEERPISTEPRPGGETGFPVVPLALASLLTAALLTLLTWHILTSSQMVQDIHDNGLAIEAVSGEIVWLDEILTMSASHAAITGDLSWRVRYDRHVEQLDRALERAVRLSVGGITPLGARQTRNANKRLVDIESRVFQLVERGDLDQARALLESPEYLQNKRIYADGVRQDLNAMREVAADSNARVRSSTRIVVWGIAIALPLLLICWLAAFLAIGRHMAARRVAENESFRAMRSARLANEAKSRFLTTMSHEIRTPLNGVIGMGDVLLATDLDGPQQRCADTIAASGRALLTLIDDILDFSQIEAGDLELEETSFDLERLVSDVVHMLMPEAEARGIELVAEITPDVPNWLVGDPVRLRQVVINFCSNGIKFTDSGHVRIIVDSTGAQDGVHQVRIAVEDTGVGIPADQLEQIFEQFSQVDGSTTRSVGGSGLGLAIVKRIVDKMGGRVGVESGGGSTFWAILPLAEAKVPANVVADRFLGENQEVQPGKKVLVVEDNPVNQLVARRLLEGFDAEVTVAAHGVEALETLRHESFDLILMDCEMPEMDGYNATRAIRKLDGDASRIPILALTANVTTEARARCFDAGMDDYIVKPATREMLRNALARWTS